MKVKAAVLSETGKPLPYANSLPLSIEEVELDSPQSGEVLVQIKAAGLCHSDLVAIDGERAKPMPMVIGHEAAGIVCKLGPEVERLAVAVAICVRRDVQLFVIRQPRQIKLGH